MRSKLQIHTRVRRLHQYIEDIEKGNIQIPAFQRDYIWRVSDILELFDSIKRGYPIGSILFWRPENETFGLTMQIGPYTVPKPLSEYFYILDGFQRLSTLFGCLINPNKTELKLDRRKWEQEFRICYDLKEEEFFIQRSRELKDYQVNVYDLIDTRASFAYQRKLQSQIYSEEEVATYMDRYETLGTILIDYQLPSIDIIGGDIEEAVKIFSRVNSKGATISPDWMLSALSYNKQKGFRLGTKIDNLLEELSIYNFQKIKRELVLNCITNSFGKFYVDQPKLEKLVQRDDFIPITEKAISSIKKAVQFLFEQMLVLEHKLLPYGAQLIFITDFFNVLDEPTDRQLAQLKRWFWITTYASYFTNYSLSKQRRAYNVFHQFLRGQVDDPIFNDSPTIPFSVNEFPNKIYFGSVRAKALVLFLLNYSNNLKPVNVNDVEGLRLLYLCKDHAGNNPPECVVPLVNRLDYSPIKSKDAAFILSSKDSEVFDRYLVTPDMKMMLERKEFQKIIERRKAILVDKKEKEFVEKLGLIYMDN